MPEKKEARIRQFLDILQRAVGAVSATPARGREMRRAAALDLVAKPKSS
jgi:hypothetical protein